MKKKSDGMSPDMFHDAMSSTPIPVFTNANDAAKNEPAEQFPSVSDVPEVSFDANQITNELIKIDFDKQTVSARALYAFLDLTERFSKWFKRMISYGLVENIDFTAVSFVICHKQPEDFTSVNNDTPPVPNGTGGIPLFTDVNNGVYQDIGDYLLTIDAAKHIAMVQRNEKGKQARNYFINIEKLYWKSVYSKNQNPVTSVTDDTPIPLLENLNSIAAQLDNLKSTVVQLEKKNFQQQQMQSNYDSLVEKTLVLEKQFVEQAAFYNLKEGYIERTISKKINMAVTDSFREAEQIRFGEELVNTLPRATNQNTVVMFNQLEKNLQKTTLEEDLIQKCYRPAERKTENALFLTATEITQHLEKFSKKVGVRNVGVALKKLGFERLHRGINGHQTKGYYVILLNGSI
jgi:phage anti-repressor protein